MTLYEIITKIASTSGSNDKKSILRENMSPTLKLIFEDTYGPQKFYIKKFEPNGDVGHLSIDIDYGTFHCMLVDLVTRTVTGDKAYQKLQETVALFDSWSQEILCKIIDRNLKVGISLDNFLDVVGEKQSKFEVALAENLNKVKGVDPIDGTYFVSRKLDGVRCVCFINKEWVDNKVTYNIHFKSRQGKPILTLNKLIKPIERFMENATFGNWVLDGEICIMDEYGNENFHGLMKEVTRKDHTIENPRYNVFDMLLLEEFNGVQESVKFSQRLDTLYSLDHYIPCIKILQQERVTSQKILDAWIETAKQNNWEGCMLRRDMPYKRGRSKDLLKIKQFVTNDYYVKKIVTGKATYNEGGSKEYNVVSSLVIEHKGNDVYVGSGISKEQRIRWFDHPEEIINSYIRVKYFEETIDSKTGQFSLRFPTLDYVYGKERFDAVYDQYLE